MEKEDIIEIINENDIRISEEEFYSVVDIYNHLVKYVAKLFDTNYIEFKNYFEFKNQHNPIFAKVFKKIIAFKRNGLFKYMDYIFIANALDYHITLRCLFPTSFEKSLIFFDEFLENILNYFFKYGNDFIYEYFDDHKTLLPEVICKYHNIIKEYLLLNEKYKDITEKFYYFYKNFYSGLYVVYEVFDKVKGLDNYVNCIYYYFLINDIFNNDFDRANRFLDSICKDLSSANDRINLMGIKSDEEMFYYVDNTYKTFDSKVKVIEQ